jgi:hypothetical protein
MNVGKLDVVRERYEINYSYHFDEEFHLTLHLNSFEGALHWEVQFAG